MTLNPLDEYKKRLQARQARVHKYDRIDHLVAQLRLVAAGLFLLTAWLVFVQRLMSARWLTVPALLFLVLVIYHEHVLRIWKVAKRATAFYEKGIARIEDRWPGMGDSHESFAPESHLYAADLDLFGKGSLFELLSTARTRSGEETLANWLCAPALRPEILARQKAVEELRNNIDLREDLTVLGADVRAGVHPDIIKRWGAAPPILDSQAARVTAFILGGLGLYALITLVRVLFSANAAWTPLLIIIPLAAFGMFYRNRVKRVIAEVDEPKRELDILSLVLARLEQESFTSEKLMQLRATLDTGGRPPSKQIARLIRHMDWLNSRLNLMFGLVSNFLLWATQFSFAIEAWRRDCGPALGRWLSTVGELEALCALAGYTYEHPRDPFPELLEDSVAVEAVDLRHPLLPEVQSIANSVHLGGDLRLLVVSGSNMSGKSTLLRTLGVNVVLALAGAPVRASRLRLSPLAVGATLRVQDSLQGGTSRFYAEIQRLHHIMDLTKGPLPVLFLLDEILHGTNSHDRAVGAEAVVRGLIQRGAIGLVTTHDLALAKVADVLAPQAGNVHFEDHLENGRITFDYRLHEGVVKKSNALGLMRAVGLDV